MRFRKEGDPEPEYWYRYWDTRYAAYDPWAEFDQPAGSNPAVHLEKCEVIKHTPCGVRLYDHEGKKRFVNRSSRKRYACPTIEEAKESFIARKRKQESIHLARARAAKEAANIIINGGVTDYGHPAPFSLNCDPLNFKEPHYA